MPNLSFDYPFRRSSADRLRIVLKALLFVVLCGTANAQMSVDEIGQRVVAAISANAAKFKNLLEVKQNWSEFSGHQYGLFLGPAPEVHTRTPVFWSHLQIVDGRPQEVLDGWDDERPLAYRFSDIHQRLGTAQPNAVSSTEIIKAFFGRNHRLELSGVVTDRDRKAYLIHATPVGRTAPSDPRAVRCAAAMRASLYIDTESFYPLRVDREIVVPNSCADADAAHPTNSNVGNIAGTQFQDHYALARANNQCGDSVEIWVSDQSTTTARIPAETFVTPGIAARSFALGRNYVGGEYKSITIVGKYQIFASCSRLIVAPEDGGSKSDPSPDQPLSDVKTESWFPIEASQSSAPPAAPPAQRGSVNNSERPTPVAQVPASPAPPKPGWEAARPWDESPAFGGPDSGGVPLQASNGVWKDPWTGLTWAQKDNGKDLTWEQARNYCQALRLGSLSDWRLPTIGELEQIYDPRQTRRRFSKGALWRQFNEPDTRVPLTGMTEYHVAGDFLLSEGLLWSSSLVQLNDGQGAGTFFFGTGHKDNATTNLKIGRALCARP